MPPSDATGPVRTRRLLVCVSLSIFLVCFLIRSWILLSGMTPQSWIRPETQNEPGRVARTLYETGRFADPYVIPTGPTAHPLPINTMLQAVLYHGFGFTLTAGYVRCFLHLAAYSLMYALLPWLAERMGLGRAAGVIGGSLGALIPYQGSGEVIGWTSNEPLAAITLALSLAALVRRWQIERTSFGKSLGIGIGFGFSFHCVPALLLVWVGCLAFDVRWARRRRRLSGSAAILLGTILVCAPWTVRNRASLGGWIFIRSNFGLELRMGNHDGATSDIDAMDRLEGATMRHPGINLVEAQLVRELGELEYMRRARREALTWIQTHPEEFLRLTGRRFLHIWFGPWHVPDVAGFITGLTVLAAVGAWNRFPRMSAPQRAAVLLPLVLFPLVYYIVVYMPRYRVPIDWILFILAGAGAWHGINRVGTWIGAKRVNTE